MTPHPHMKPAIIHYESYVHQNSYHFKNSTDRAPIQYKDVVLPVKEIP